MRLSLHDVHHALGAQFGLSGDIEIPQSYGDWRAEHAAVRGSVGLIDCGSAGRLHGTGPDFAQVLHGVVTNEVKNLPAGWGCLAALLNDVGRAQTLLVILRVEDGFLIETPPGLAEKSRDLIDYYIITEDATIEDESAQWGQFSLQGPKAREVLATLFEGTLPALDRPALWHAAGRIDGHGVRVVRRTRTGEDGYDVWVSADDAAVVWKSLIEAAQAAGGRAVGAEALQALRVEASIPQYGEDLDDTTIPLETGLMSAISENKGCYLGQEIIARILNLSKPVRSFVGLVPQGDVSVGDKLMNGEKEVGRVTSAVDSPTLGHRIALAYIRTDLLARGMEEVMVNGAPARIQRGPFHQAGDAPQIVVPPSPSAKKLLG